MHTACVSTLSFQPFVPLRAIHVIVLSDRVKSAIEGYTGVSIALGLRVTDQPRRCCSVVVTGTDCSYIGKYVITISALNLVSLLGELYSVSQD